MTKSTESNAAPATPAEVAVPAAPKTRKKRESKPNGEADKLRALVAEAVLVDKANAIISMLTGFGVDKVRVTLEAHARKLGETSTT
jgi:hypothetical protein